MAEKSILEQALLQVGTLEEAVKQNAKGILSSVMKKELSDLLKESKEEEDEAFKSNDETASSDEEGTNDMSGDEESKTDDEDSEDATSDDADDETADDDDTDLDNDPSKGIDSLDSDDEMSHDEPDADNAGGASDFDSDNEDDDVMDMTGASDAEVMKVFKAMKPEDGIVVKKDGNTVSFNDGDQEYIIKLDDESPATTPEEEGGEEEDDTFSPMDGMGTNHSSEEEEDESMALYEIELDETEEEQEEATEGALKGLSNPKKVEPKESALKGLSNPKKVEPKESALKGLSNPKKVEPKESALKGLSNPKKVEPKEEVEATEAARTKSNPHGDKNGMDRAGLSSKKKYKAGSGVFGINEEVETLKKQNDEYKKALVLFKEKLNEVAIFNANLAYFTRLVTENSTTKQEKLTILKRFDTVSSMNESKNLFNTIKTELETKTVTESVANKISNTPTTSTSQEVLAESKAYENPQFKRMKDLMSKIK